MNSIHSELDSLLEHEWEHSAKESIQNIKNSLKSYGFLLPKNMHKDVLTLVRLANDIKSEMNALLEVVKIQKDQLQIINNVIIEEDIKIDGNMECANPIDNESVVS